MHASIPALKPNNSNIFEMIDSLALMRTIEKAFAMVDTTLTGGVVANAFIAVAMGASMKRMWSLLNTL